MRWWTSVGSWARRKTVLRAAIGLGTAVAGLAIPLGAPWLLVVGVVAVAVGALGLLAIELLGARTEDKQERTESRRFLRVPVAPIGEIDPVLIGVDRAEQAILPGGGVPSYVPRTADVRLRAAVHVALHGEPWIVVVRGVAKVGKSRSLFEAVRAASQSASIELVAPASGKALESLLTPGLGLRLPKGRAVLWLDDLEPFLDDGVTLQQLREWHAGVTGRIVAATYGGKGAGLVRGSPTTGLATIAQEVLQHAAEIDLEKTTTAELAGSTQGLSDAQAGDLEQHGLAAYLVAGPILERKLRTGIHGIGEDPSPDGVALVRAAVDWARCGRTDPVDSSELRGLWSSYRGPGAILNDDDFERALEWALRPVAGTIALLHGAGSFQAFDYVVRLLRDDPRAESPLEEAWTTAILSASDAQALAVGAAAYQHERRADALRALSAARQSQVQEVAAIAGFNVGVVLNELDRSSEALEVYDEVVSRFGDAPESGLREHVIGALVNKGATLGQLGRAEEAIEAYDAVVSRFGDAPEAAQREPVAGAQFSKGVWLSQLGRSEEAIEAYDEVVSRFGDASEEALRRLVARALFNKGARLGQLDRSEEAIEAYDEVVSRFGDATEAALRDQVAKALFNKGATLGQLDRAEEEIEAYDEVVSRFGDAPEAALRDQVAGALFNKGATLGQLDRSEEAIAAYDEVVSRFGDAPEAGLRDHVAGALINKAVTLGQLERSEEAIEVYDEAVSRFGDAPEAALSRLVERASYVQQPSDEGSDPRGSIVRTGGTYRKRSAPER